jgi:hypothetical protein
MVILKIFAKFATIKLAKTVMDPYFVYHVKITLFLTMALVAVHQVLSLMWKLILVK